MAQADRDQSIHDEPQFRGSAGQSDPSEERATRALARDAIRTAQSGEGNDESVFDEPDFLPGRAAELITRDWCCSQCGYNLRGLKTGDRCPECGAIELYRPPPDGGTSYGARLSALIAKTSDATAWRTAIGLALIGGPWAVLAAFLPMNPALPFANFVPIHVLLTGPIVEEVMKIGAVATVLEIAPHRFKRIEQIQVATIGSAFAFAAIENLIYMFVYFPNHSTWFAIYRWTVCVALHIGCTALATRGLVGVWERTITEGRRPIITRAFPAVIVAIVLHACYNASALIYDFATR